MRTNGKGLRPVGRIKKPIGMIAACTLPAFFLTVYFTFIPTFRALFMSFTDGTTIGFDKLNFVKFSNYTYMFGDRHFIKALGNTANLMLVVPLVTILISLILAFVITQTRLKEKGFYRTAFFFPSIISMTVVSIVWSFVFHPTMGILNTLLEGAGLAVLVRPWLGDAGTALWCVAATLVWQAAGYYMVMHIAAMDSISPELYEAATIDGAGAVRKLVSITIPHIKDIVGITYVLSLSGTINLSFVLASVMTNGGPNGASTVLLQYMYNQGMRNANFGYAMAITVFTLAISIGLSMLSRRMTGRQEGEVRR